MVNKGNHPQIALLQVSAIPIYIYTYYLFLGDDYHLSFISYHLSPTSYHFIYHLSSWCLAIIWHCYQTQKSDDPWESPSGWRKMKWCCWSAGIPEAKLWKTPVLPLGSLGFWCQGSGPCDFRHAKGNPSAKPRQVQIFSSTVRRTGQRSLQCLRPLVCTGLLKTWQGQPSWVTWGMDQWVTCGFVWK